MYVHVKSQTVGHSEIERRSASSRESAICRKNGGGGNRTLARFLQRNLSERRVPWAALQDACVPFLRSVLQCAASPLGRYYVNAETWIAPRPGILLLPYVRAP
jgi:hypothetical protein